LTYTTTILHLTPDAQFAISGDDYSTLQWFGPGDAPTEQQILDAMDAAALAAARAAKRDELIAACIAAITAGFTSDALGSNHFYPCQATDQTNLAAVVIESLLTPEQTEKLFPFWCYDGATWERREHTHAQIRAVGLAAVPHVRDKQDRLRDLRLQVLAATTVEQINGIVW